MIDCEEYYINHRGLFKTLLKFQDGAFCKYNERLLAVDFLTFLEKVPSNMLDIIQHANILGIICISVLQGESLSLNCYQYDIV